MSYCITLNVYKSSAVAEMAAQCYVCYFLSVNNKKHLLSRSVTNLLRSIGLTFAFKWGEGWYI